MPLILSTSRFTSSLITAEFLCLHAAQQIPHPQSNWPYHSSGHDICSGDCLMPIGGGKNDLSSPAPTLALFSLIHLPTPHCGKLSSTGPLLGPSQPLLDLWEEEKAWSQAPKTASMLLTSPNPHEQTLLSAQAPLKAIMPLLWKWRGETPSTISCMCVHLYLLFLPRLTQLPRPSLLFNV